MEKLGLLKTKKAKFISSFISAIIFLIGQGTLYGAAGITVYILSYIHHKDNWVNMQYGNLILSLMVMATSLFSPLSGPLEKAVGPFFSILIGSVIIELSLFIFFIQRNIWLFYLAGLLAGLGYGLSLNIPIKNACFYYPAKKGLISAIIICSVLIAGALFILIGENIINPEKEGVIDEKNEPYYSEKISEREKHYFIFTLIVFPIIAFTSLFLFYKYNPNCEIEESKNQIQISKIQATSKGTENNEEENKENDNKEEENKENDNNEEENKENDNNEEENKENDELKKDLINKNKKERLNSFYKISTTKDIFTALKSFRFWRIIIISGLMPFFHYFLQASYRPFVVMLGVNTKIIFYLGSIVNVISCLGLPIWASFLDKFGYQPIMKIIGFISTGTDILFAFFVNNPNFYPYGLMLSFAVFAGINSSVNPHLMQVFGMTYFLTIGGIAKLFIELSNLSAALTTIVLSVFFKNADELRVPYRIVAIVGCFLSALGLFLIFFENDDKFNYDDEDDKCKKKVDKKKVEIKEEGKEEEQNNNPENK